ncbi:MAG: SGNH/GDSL hydrolase family protein, partial [Kiritimatiellae bacterium]|nr:SGNH/GDSL hydrolase family protein [Kiritimatiellia bacterium]
WVAGEFDDDKSAHGGLEFALNGNTTNALGQVVIGDSTTLGATIAIPEGFDNATMLVKYEIPSGGAPAANSVPASVFVTKEMGALAGNASSSLGGYWLNGSTVTTGYAFSSPAPSIPLDGYLLISAPANSNKNQGNHFTAVYVGETIANLSGGEAGSGSSGLRFTGPNNRVTSVGIGGPTVAGAVPWEGMVIKSVALFDEWVATNVIANYKFPAQGAVQPEDSDLYVVEPVASWVNDFKTTTKGDYSLSVSGTTAAKDDTFGGTLTIGDAAAIIDTTAANSAKLTVLIKYRAASNVTNAPVVAFGGTAPLFPFDVGVYTKSDKTLAVYRNFNDDNTKPYDFGTAPVLSATGGYVLCARDNGQQCMAYVGDSLDAMTGGTVSNGGIKFSNVTLTKLGIGGNSGLPANANDMVPFAGLEIEKIVVFSGYYTPDQIRYVENPEDGDTVNIASGATWKFAAGETRTYTNIGTLNEGGTIAITNAATLVEGTYKLAEWTTPQQYTTQGAGYGKVGTLVTDGLAEGLSARLVYGARAIYLRVDDTAKQAARKPLVVWCYGDSITEGYNAQATGANYRILLYQKLEMLGYNVRSTGVYGLSNGYNSVDPSGTPLTDQYRWHSAKHGATAGPSSLSHRSNLSENVDTLAIQAGTPDVALLLIGVNDLPQFSTVEPVFAAWTNIVNRLVNNLPDTKIIASTILYSDGTRTDIDPKITEINNNYIKPLMANMPEAWQGHVVLADLNSIVKSGQPGIIYSDHLHPDWWGYDQMADGYLDKIVECYPDPDAEDFPSQNPIPDAPTEDQLGAANKPELAAYREGFKKLCNIRVEKGQDVKNVVYDDVNSDAVSENIGKVGYFVEFVRDDNHAHKWVWVDMDAFGGRDLASVGLPQRIYQQAVTKMHVCSNHGAIDNVAADDDSVTGWIEFSPYDYTRTGSNSAAPANYGEPFDWNDTLSESGSYGCMQVFRVMSPSSRDLYERPQLMFAFNNFQSQNSNPADFGIGNFAQHFNCNNSYHVEDWTGVSSILAKMTPDQYSVKTIEIWTKEKATDTDFPTPYSWIDMYFPELVSGWGSTDYNDFATNKNHGSVKNGYAPWESYVLGLDPTNAMSKFVTTIRMDGTTPVVEYSPTNEVLKAVKAIEYVLQGKPALTNGWQDVEFDEPGDTNRFFRVKVTWGIQ